MIIEESEEQNGHDIRFTKKKIYQRQKPLLILSLRICIISLRCES